MSKQLPFKKVAEAALGRAEALVAQWLPDGKRSGPEWKALNPTRGDSSVGSFSVNLVTGAWGDFACGDAGGDLVSLHAYLFNAGDQGAAVRELAEALNIDISDALNTRHGARDGKAAAAPSSATEQPEPPPPEKKRSSPWISTLAVPADAPAPPVAHEFRGKPEATWIYRDAAGKVIGYVYRFVTSDGGKDVQPLTWCVHEKSRKAKWWWKAFPDPGRPLYGLDRLAQKTGATVLVVEGEKCADVAHEHLPELVAVSWPGGSNVPDKADWSPLAGRKVILWPDCDAQRDKKTQELLPDKKQPGIKAMRKIADGLLALGCRVWIVEIPPPGSKPSGWDIADAVAEGFVGTALDDYVRTSLRELLPEPPEADETPPDAERAPAAGKGYIPNLIWTKNGLASCMPNAFQILMHTEHWRGVVAFDDFSHRVVKLKPPPFEGGAVGEWDSTDDSRTSIWLAQREPDWKFTPSSSIVAEAIEVIGRANAVHPVRAWLESLPPWDEVRRGTDWLTDCLGVEKNAYTMRVGTWYLRAMVARVMNPGCKFDYCLVLEGPQGKGKSTALKILGGDWYADTDLDLHNKDAMSALRGKWVYEFPELGSVTRVEERKQKSFLSRDVDEYRPVYGRREIKSKRQLVFAGTTNEWEWNKDPTGGRRFWPVECGDIDHEVLRGMRDQLFAEALHDFRAGKRYWPTPEEQETLFDPQQLKIEMPDSLVDRIHDWVYEQPRAFSLATAMEDGLNIKDVSKHTRDLQIRVGTALRKLGCTKIERRNGMTRFWYEPPARKETWSKPTSPAQHDQEDDHVPF